MRKVITAILLTAILVMSQLAVFASPDTIAADSAGNSNGLVVVTRPKNQKDSTFDNAYIISGYGKEGTTVTLYSFSAVDGIYKKIYNETQFVDENGVAQKVSVASEVKIGASGLFMNTIPLSQGVNDVLVRAENGDKIQLMKLSLTKYSYNLFDIIKSLTD
ncbi:MAG: hypothetical protein E7401_01190 [Ruminococcaceae bacterium]|nr:hypothetical protein [Oscillospiraceae bacterium]